MDDSAKVEETRDYSPFGLPMPGRYEKGSPPTKEDFTGHVKDGETGLHYAGARYYSSAFARWTTTDPILGEKGPKKLLKQGTRLLTMTSYNYAFDNPATLVDPTGLAPTDWFIDSSGELQFDQRVKEADDVPTGGKYLGESFTANVGDETLFFGAQGGVFESFPMEGIVVFGGLGGNSGQRGADAAALGFSAISGAAQAQSDVFGMAEEFAGSAKTVKTVTDVASRLTALAQIGLSSGSAFFGPDPVGTAELTTLGADAVLGGLGRTNFVGAFASIGLDAGGSKKKAVRAITRFIEKRRSRSALLERLRIRRQK